MRWLKTEAWIREGVPLDKKPYIVSDGSTSDIAVYVKNDDVWVSITTTKTINVIAYMPVPEYDREAHDRQDAANDAVRKAKGLYLQETPRADDIDEVDKDLLASLDCMDPFFVRWGAFKEDTKDLRACEHYYERPNQGHDKS